MKTLVAREYLLNAVMLMCLVTLKLSLLGQDTAWNFNRGGLTEVEKVEVSYTLLYMNTVCQH